MFRRRLLLSFLTGLTGFFCISTRLSAQSKIPEEYYVFDKDMHGTTADQAVYFLSVRKLADTVWEWDTYNFKGPLIRMQTFSDHDGKNLNGRSYFYTTEGDLDSIAEFRSGVKEGTFYRLASTGSGPKDSLVWKKKYVYHNDSLVSAEDVPHADLSDTSGGDRESVYPGGIKKWTAYLSKTLTFPERAYKLDIQGLVRAVFTVDKEGNIRDMYIGRSVEYSLDREVERVIKKSGKWIPGMKNGVPVSTFKEQPVNMMLR